MANITKLFTVRAHSLLQAAARQPQVATRFSSSCKYSKHHCTKIKVHF